MVLSYAGLPSHAQVVLLLLVHLAGLQALPVPHDIVHVGLIARNVHVLLLVVSVTVLAVRLLDDVLGRGVQLVHLASPQALLVPRGIDRVGLVARNVHVLLLVSRATVLIVRNLDIVLGHGVQQVAHPVARVLPRRDPEFL